MTSYFFGGIKKEEAGTSSVVDRVKCGDLQQRVFFLIIELTLLVFVVGATVKQQKKRELRTLSMVTAEKAATYNIVNLILIQFNISNVAHLCWSGNG